MKKDQFDHPTSVRFTAEQVELFKKAAQKEVLPVTAWMRQTLVLRAKEVLNG